MLAEAQVVYHLAGCPDVRDPRPDVAQHRYRDNVLATTAVLAVVPDQTPLLVTSSSSVYGGTRAGRPSAETDPLRPRGGYARSKLLVEQLCQGRTQAGGSVTLLRPFTVAGEGQRPGMALARWIDAARSGLPLQLLGGPQRSRYITDVRDVVQVLVDLADRRACGVFNVGEATRTCKGGEMTTPRDVNHHAGHPGFAGVTGLLVGLIMIIGRGAVTRLAADLACVSDEDRVVDVGCGPGAAVREAARRGARVAGVDPAPVMLRLARTLTRDRPAITWAEGTAEDLRQPDGSATVVWALATVHHWTDVTAGLAEAQRVLAPGGRLLAIERRVRPGATGLASHGWTDLQAESFAAQCAAAGFDDVRVEKHTPGRRAVWVVRAVRP